MLLYIIYCSVKMLCYGSLLFQVICHLGKLFDSLTDLEFSDGEENNTAAVGMFSREREYVSFYTQCDCDGPVKSMFESNMHKIQFN